MITGLLGIDAADALPATTALNLVAIANGASVLRVHDVAEAVQAVELSRALGM
jgi:dihydropteroate synthase